RASNSGAIRGRPPPRSWPAPKRTFVTLGWNGFRAPELPRQAEGKRALSGRQASPFAKIWIREEICPRPRRGLFFVCAGNKYTARNWECRRGRRSPPSPTRAVYLALSHDRRGAFFFAPNCGSESRRENLIYFPLPRPGAAASRGDHACLEKARRLTAHEFGP